MKRFIIILIALISSTLAFNQAVKAQNRIKVPVFESVVAAKNGSVNIRKEASTKSDKIGKIYANRRFYPLLDETDEWYCILLPATEDESQKKDGLVRCGYVSKTYSKAIMYVVPHSFDSKKDWPGGESKDFDNKGVEVMYVDMEKYPFKTETIQICSNKPFYYSVVGHE